MRAVAGRPVRIRFTLEDEGGVPTAPDASTNVSCAVLDGAGTLVSTGTAALDSAVGYYVYTAPAQTKLDLLSATFVATVGGSSVTTTVPVQIVDRRVVPLSVLRAEDTLASLAVPDFLRFVDDAEDAMESLLNFSPVMSSKRVDFQADYTARLYVPGVYYPQVPYSMVYQGTAWTQQQLSQLTVRGHALEYVYNTYVGGPYDPILGTYGSPFPAGQRTVHLAHGLPVTPGDLVKATTGLTKHIARSSAYPDRATRVMTEMTDIWLSTPDGDKRLTGLPEVDGVLMRYRISSPFSEDPGFF